MDKQRPQTWQTVASMFSEVKKFKKGKEKSGKYQA